MVKKKNIKNKGGFPHHTHEKKDPRHPGGW
jgi:hypothetical protein